MKRAEKLSHMAERVKRDRIKETQDTWRSQFEENDQERLHRANLDQKYKDVNKERRGGEEGDERGDEEVRMRKQMQYNQEARNEEFAELEGERIYLKGLDLGMLRREKELERKQRVAPDFTARINEKMRLVENIKKVGANKLYKDMIERIKNPPPNPSKPLVTQNTHYQFDINWTFGSLIPRVITKQPPRHHKNPSFPGITDQQVSEIFYIIQNKHRRDEVQKQQEIQKLKMVEDDSDDIFGEVKEDDVIQVGAKLEFGVGNIDNIYETQPSNLPSNEIDLKIMELEKAQKRKKLLEGDEQGDYYEEFWGSGPSLQHLQTLRKQGISFYQFYDQKNKRVDKEKKVDLNREYGKIQRIIAQKEGKGQGK